MVGPDIQPSTVSVIWPYIQYDIQLITAGLDTAYPSGHVALRLKDFDVQKFQNLFEFFNLCTHFLLGYPVFSQNIYPYPFFDNRISGKISI